MITETSLEVTETSLEVRAGHRRRRRRLPFVPMAIIGVLVIFAIFAPLVAPHSPDAQRLTDRLLPPMWEQGGRADYLLGTDQLGRDMFSRIIFGARISFEAALAALLLGGGTGGILGLLAGYYGGRIGTVIMRIADGTLSLPVILLALLLAITIGPGLGTIIVVFVIVIWAPFARLMRGEVLSIKERDWVTQARINGCSDFRIMAVHIMPHVTNTWVVLATLQMGFVILMEASLSFLGAGIPPPTSSWGQMVAEGRGLITLAWWLSVIPGIAIMLLVLSFNMVGDWLRETLDPKLRQV